MIWRNPIPRYTLIETTDSNSFLQFNPDQTGLPLPPHCGSFGIQRTHDVHTGIDLYCDEHTQVFAVESGRVIDVGIFTGEKVESPWWNETFYVSVLGNTGVVVYGEIKPCVNIGDIVDESSVIGTVMQVLKRDKGRPRSMLHLELMQDGYYVDPARYLQDNSVYSAEV